MYRKLGALKKAALNLPQSNPPTSSSHPLLVTVYQAASCPTIQLPDRISSSENTTLCGCKTTNRGKVEVSEAIGLDLALYTLTVRIFLIHICKLYGSFRRKNYNPQIMPQEPQSPVVTLCTTRFNIHKFYVLSTLCIYVFLYGSRNKQRLFPYTALTDRFILTSRSVFTARYKRNV
jgi:hypothetical protein